MVLAFLALTLSSCIFVRLSRVLVQMKAPELHLKVDLEKESFDAELLKPIVLMSDLEWLLGRKGIQDDDHVKLVFKKMGPQDRHPWMLKFELDSKSRIRRVQLPQRLTTVMGNDFVMRAIEAIGRAEVSILKRRVAMKLEHHVRWSQISELMGAPMTQTKNKWVYQFGEKASAFVVTVTGDASVDGVRLEASGYGANVEVLPTRSPEVRDKN
jgi:hypothetical protein